MDRLKICLVTGTRAEYGLLRNIIKLLSNDAEVDFRLVATGTHLCEEFGRTVEEIRGDGFQISEEIHCVDKRSDDVGMVLSTANALEGFAKYFENNRPEMLIVLGDRYEIFACVTAAAMLKIPVAHLYGGDTTEGAIDEFFRHSITKMSYLHFVSNEASRNRVIQLGEHPSRVFNYGATGAENIVEMNFLPKEELSKTLGLDLNKKYALVTYHPVTMENETPENQMVALFEAIDQFNEVNFIFTKSNADGNGKIINDLIDNYALKRENVFVFTSLGITKYLSAMKYSSFVLGNSSSGIYETPLFGIPTVNIGDRQRGRLQATTIINCKSTKEAIAGAINQALSYECDKSQKSPYYKEHTAENIVEEIKKTIKKGKINLKKSFYNVE